MEFKNLLKYRDILYLTVGLVFLVLFIHTCNKPVDLGIKMDIEALELKNKSLEHNIKLLNDSLESKRKTIDSLSKVEVKIEKKRNKIINKGNEELKNIYTKSDSATHELFTRYLAREDSIYKGLLPGIIIIPRKIN